MPHILVQVRDEGRVGKTLARRQQLASPRETP